MKSFAILLSHIANGTTSHHSGAFSAARNGLLFEENSKITEIPFDLVVYIDYLNSSTLIACKNGTEKYVISTDENSSHLEAVQEEIETRLEEWIRADSTGDRVKKVTSLLSSREKSGEVVRSMDIFGIVARTVQEGRKETAQEIVKELGYIHTPEIFSFLVSNVPTVSKLFSIPYEKTVGIGKYVRKEFVENSRRLQWLEKHFYTGVLSLGKVRGLDKLIQKSQAETLSFIGNTEIPQNMSKGEIRNALAQLECSDKSMLKEFLCVLHRTKLIEKCTEFEDLNDAYIVQIAAKYLPNSVFEHLEPDTGLLARLCKQLQSSVEKKDSERSWYFSEIVMGCFSIKNTKISLILTKYLPLIFEKAGRPRFYSQGRWRMYRTEHILTEHHLKILLYLTTRMTAHIKLYAIESGLLFSIEEVFRTEKGEKQVIAAKIVLVMLQIEDKAIRKYMKETQLAEKIEETVSKGLFEEPRAIYGLFVRIEETMRAYRREMTN